MKIVFFIFLILKADTITAQKFLFDTSFEVIDVFNKYFVKSNEDIDLIYEKMIKIRSVYTGESDTTIYERSNRRGQTEYIFEKLSQVGGIKDYECWITYTKNYDPLWRSDDTVVINHRADISISDLPDNKITLQMRALRFVHDSNNCINIQTSLFFKNERKTILVQYKDLNSNDNKAFFVTFQRKNNYYVLKS